MRLLELDRLDWDRIRRRRPEARVVCGGRLKANPCTPRLFVCRSTVCSFATKRHRGSACGRYCCACEGGDDNRCSRCSNQLERALARKNREPKK